MKKLNKKPMRKDHPFNIAMALIVTFLIGCAVLSPIVLFIFYVATGRI